MIKLQQFTFVCARSPSSGRAWPPATSRCPNARPNTASIAIFCSTNWVTFTSSPQPSGFYLFAKTPLGNRKRIRNGSHQNNLLIIPGNVFSDRDTHFRISYAAEHRTLERGVEVLKKLAKR